MKPINKYSIVKEATLMFFWNKVEIYSGSSLKEFTDLRNSLETAKIKYDYHTKHSLPVSHHSNRHTLGSKAGIKYYLYIHQKDYEYAMYLTSNRQLK